MTCSSRKLSKLLRHTGLPNVEGWASVEVLLDLYGYSEDCIRRIVANDEKQRYELSEDGQRVRALYGHSNHVRIQWPIATPPNILYHGTSRRNIETILQDGLKKMSRHYVHLSKSIEDAIKVGKRHGESVVLTIDTQKIISDGGVFYKVPNGIWLTDDIKPQYLSIYS